MHRRFLFFFFLGIFLFPAASFGRSNASESQTLQALLTEVRQVRQELHGSMVKVRGAQIVIARLQLEETAVEHASQRLDDARSKLTGVQGRETHISAKIGSLEDILNSVDQSSEFLKPQLQAQLHDLRSELEAAKNEESLRQTAETDAEQHLRTEQGERDTLQAQLDEIVKRLDAGAQSGSTSH